MSHYSKDAIADKAREAVLEMSDIELMQYAEEQKIDWEKYHGTYIQFDDWMRFIEKLRDEAEEKKFGELMHESQY
jgi:hypothetical protein